MDIDGIEKIIIERDVENDIIWMSVAKYFLFMSYGKVGMDAKNLYEHFQFTSRLQETNCIWALDTYCREGLGWGKDRMAKAKALLIDLDLIETRVTRKADGTFDKRYIKVKTKQSPLEPSDIIHCPPNPLVDEPTGGFQETNALTKNIKCLNKERERSKSHCDPTETPPDHDVQGEDDSLVKQPEPLSPNTPSSAGPPLPPGSTFIVRNLPSFDNDGCDHKFMVPKEGWTQEWANRATKMMKESIRNRNDVERPKTNSASIPLGRGKKGRSVDPDASGGISKKGREQKIPDEMKEMYEYVKKVFAQGYEQQNGIPFTQWAQNGKSISAITKAFHGKLPKFKEAAQEFYRGTSSHDDLYKGLTFSPNHFYWAMDKIMSRVGGMSNEEVQNYKHANGEDKGKIYNEKMRLEI